MRASNRFYGIGSTWENVTQYRDKLWWTDGRSVDIDNEVLTWCKDNLENNVYISFDLDHGRPPFEYYIEFFSDSDRLKFKEKWM